MRKLISLVALLSIGSPVLAEDPSIVDDARVMSTAIRYWGKSLGPDVQLKVATEYMGVASIGLASLSDQLLKTGLEVNRINDLVKNFFARNETAKQAAPPNRSGDTKVLSFRPTIPGYDADRTHALVFGTPDDGFIYHATLEKVNEEEWRVIASGLMEPVGIEPKPRAAVPDGVSPHRVGGDVKAPRVIRRVEPVYPDEAREAGISGVVILEVIIDKTGRLRSVEVLKGLRSGIDQAAVNAVKQWTFEPATLNGEPVDVFFNLSLNFRLDKPKP